MIQINLLISDSEGPMEVYVSAIINPSKFFIQNIRHSTELKQLVDDMTNYYEDVKNRELHALKKVSKNFFVNYILFFFSFFFK